MRILTNGLITYLWHKTIIVCLTQSGNPFAKSVHVVNYPRLSDNVCALVNATSPGESKLIYRITYKET